MKKKTFQLPTFKTKDLPRLLEKEEIRLSKLPEKLSKAPKIMDEVQNTPLSRQNLFKALQGETIDRNVQFTPVGDPSPELKRKVKERDGYACVRCGRKEDREKGIYLHVDHAKPRCRGGQNTLDNLQTLCFNCNTIWKNDSEWFGPTLKK